jgi:hypothetical protein
LHQSGAFLHHAQVPNGTRGFVQVDNGAFLHHASFFGV